MIPCLIVIFGALAVTFMIGGFVIAMVYGIRGSPRKAYQIYAISCALGVPSAGIAMALDLQDLNAFFFSLVLGTFTALICWLMSRFIKL